MDRKTKKKIELFKARVSGKKFSNYYERTKEHLKRHKTVKLKGRIIKHRS